MIGPFSLKDLVGFLHDQQQHKEDDVVLPLNDAAIALQATWTAYLENMSPKLRAAEAEKQRAHLEAVRINAEIDKAHQRHGDALRLAMPELDRFDMVRITEDGKHYRARIDPPTAVAAALKREPPPWVKDVLKQIEDDK